MFRLDRHLLNIFVEEYEQGRQFVMFSSRSGTAHAVETCVACVFNKAHRQREIENGFGGDCEIEE